MGKRAPVVCQICSRPINRKADLLRHIKSIHEKDKTEGLHHCPIENCERTFVQKSNLNTHLAIHLGERPQKCPKPDCDFACADPGFLTRHRTELHGYVPNPRVFADGRKKSTTRNQARSKPYERRQKRASGSNDSAENGLDQPNELTWVHETQSAPKACVQAAPFDWTPVTTSVASTAGHPRPPVPLQSHVTGAATIQPVCDMAVTNEVLDNFLVRFGDWQPTWARSVFASTSTDSSFYEDPFGVNPTLAPSSAAPYQVEDAATPAGPSFYEDTFGVDTTLPAASYLAEDTATPRGPSFYEDTFGVDNTLPAASYLAEDTATPRGPSFYEDTFGVDNTLPAASYLAEDAATPRGPSFYENTFGVDNTLPAAPYQVEDAATSAGPLFYEDTLGVGNTLTPSPVAPYQVYQDSFGIGNTLAPSSIVPY